MLQTVRDTFPAFGQWPLSSCVCLVFLPIQAGRDMTDTPRDLPLDLDDIDASWLSDILQIQFPGVTVETCRRTGGIGAPPCRPVMS